MKTLTITATDRHRFECQTLHEKKCYRTKKFYAYAHCTHLPFPPKRTSPTQGQSQKSAIATHHKNPFYNPTFEIN